MNVHKINDINVMCINRLTNIVTSFNQVEFTKNYPMVCGYADDNESQKLEKNAAAKNGFEFLSQLQKQNLRIKDGFTFALWLQPAKEDIPPPYNGFWAVHPSRTTPIQVNAESLASEKLKTIVL
jgi:hypothetical protein